MPTPHKSDPLLMFRVEQLEADHVSTGEIDTLANELKELKDELREFKRSVLNGLKWVIGLLAGGIITVITGLIVAYLTRGF